MNKYQQIDKSFAALNDEGFYFSSPELATDDSVPIKITSTVGSKSPSFLRPVFAMILFSLAILCGYFALPTTKSVAVSTQPTQTVKKLVTKDIEEIHCGERVLGKNPVLSEEDRQLFGAEPTQETHYEYFFALPKNDNSLILVTLLRPRDWLEQNELVREFEEETETGEVEKGIVVWLELPEMGAVGWAELLAINDDFEIKTGKGNIVTGTYAHLASNVIDLKIEGQDSIGCTDNHPFWSVDRQDYIPAGKLQEGENVLLYSGETKRVEQILPRSDPDVVYNIEVFGEHVYHVTTDGVLVHNDCLPKIEKHHSLPQFIGGNKNQPLTVLEQDIHREYHQELYKTLEKRGLPPANTSTIDWAEFMKSNKRSQIKAFAAALEAAKHIDAKHGTKIVKDLLDNFRHGHYTKYP